jgi:hypothetical protein
LDHRGVRHDPSVAPLTQFEVPSHFPPPEFQNATLQTLRHRVLSMPAQSRRTGNRPRPLLPASDPSEAAWKYALHQIEHIKL